VLLFVILSMDGDRFVVSDMMTLQVRRIVRSSKIDAKYLLVFFFGEGGVAQLIHQQRSYIEC